MPVFKVRLPDEEYLFDTDDMLGSEWGAIEEETGLTYDEWTVAIDQRKWVPCQVLIWFLRQKNGRPEVRREVDFKIRQLDVERVPDPKGPGSTRSRRSTGKPSGTASE